MVKLAQPEPSGSPGPGASSAPDIDVDSGRPPDAEVATAVAASRPTTRARAIRARNERIGHLHCGRVGRPGSAGSPRPTEGYAVPASPDLVVGAPVHREPHA